MARPIKNTVDYFPHYISWGKTMTTLEAQYGNDGYAFWWKMLEILGNTEGHYLDCSDELTWMYLISKAKVSEEKAFEIINLLVRLGAIDSDLWITSKIIWSQNFVDNLKPLYDKRTVVPEKPKVKGFRGENHIKEEFPHRKLRFRKVLGKSTPQSKVKESKVKKSREEESKDVRNTALGALSHSKEYEESKKQYADNVSMTADQYNKLLQELGEDRVNWCISKLNAWKGSNPTKAKKRKDDYLSIKNWVINALEEHEARTGKSMNSTQTIIPLSRNSKQAINVMHIAKKLDSEETPYDIFTDG